MLIVDCDTCFGVLPSSPKDFSLETLISAAHAQSVGYVMAYSLRAKAFDAREGNDLTLAAAREHDEILPVATVDPRRFRDYAQEIKRAAELGFVALRVFPEAQGWSIDSLLFERILDECEQCNLPLMIAADAPGKASLITRKAAGVQVPVVLLNTSYSLQSEALEAARSRPDTYLSTQYFVTPQMAEIAAEAVGAERLVFGTQSPDFSVRQALNMILMSELPDSQKEMILGGNLQRLLAGQHARLGKTLLHHDMAAYNAMSIRQPIIDVHGHNGPWPFPMGGASVKELEQLMRRRGIEKAVISSTMAITHDFVEGNAQLARELQESDCVFGYVTVNPNYPQQSIKEMQRYLDTPQFVGIKFHPSYAAAAIDCEGTRTIARVAATRPVPFLIHTWGPGAPAKIRNLAAEFPELPIIMGHGGATAWMEAIDVLKDCPNVYTEFCASQCNRGKVRQTIDAAGTRQILFGSDLGLFDPAFCLGVYEEADMTQDEQRAVVYQNAFRLFEF